MSPRESRPGKCALMRSTSGGISAIWILWASTMLHHDESCSIMLQRLCASDCLRSNLISRERFKSAKRYQYLCKIYCTEYTLDSVCVCGNTVIDFFFNFVLRFSVSSANIVSVTLPANRSGNVLSSSSNLCQDMLMLFLWCSISSREALANSLQPSERWTCQLPK